MLLSIGFTDFLIDFLKEHVYLLTGLVKYNLLFPEISLLES